MYIVVSCTSKKKNKKKMNQLVRDTARWKSGSMEEKKARVGPYFIMEEIGEGHTGTVRLALNVCTGAKSAVKIVDKTISRKRKDARKEIRILENINHESIIHLDHVEEDLQNIYIFTEYFDQGDLYSFIEKNGTFDEYISQNLLKQMVCAVEFCHRVLKVCHHDIKLENFVINSQLELKLIDFGFAIELEPSSAGEQLTVFDSSPAYSPLEILLRRPHDSSVDIFSLGVCLYFMLCGCFPFCDAEKTTYEELVSNVQAGVIDFPLGLSPEVQDLICGMLSKTSSTRLRFEEIKVHSWYYNCT